MSELDALKRALREDRVSARPAAKTAAVAAALDAYDVRRAETVDRARQGLGFGGRLRNAATAVFETMTGRRPMTHIAARRALAGGASLAVLTLAVVAVTNLETIEGFGRFSAPRQSVPVDRSVVDERVAGRPGQQAGHPDAAPVISSGLERDEIASVDENEAGFVRHDIAMDAPEVLTAAPAEEFRKRAPGSAMLAEVAEQEQLAAAPAFTPIVSELPPVGYREQGRDRFETIETNPLKVTVEEPVSTFSIDVDSASYAFMRAAINSGVLPPDDAVRVEELINYFPYDYAGPASAEEPFRATATIMPTPWNAETKLLHIGIKGFDITSEERKRANLVFLIDTSGSMNEPNKLPLLVNAMKLLVDQLAADDTVSIVTYAGGAGTVLEPTAASDEATIVAALERLSAGGSTAGAEGIRQAYQLARRSFDAEGVNRVILATDGDFNVGITDIDELRGFVERERDSGVFLSVLGFGRGNYNDALMQALAQNGNGTAAYIDTLNEARKVLVEEATSTLFPIAKDVKIQVEFNPARVAEYRLIGYENRLLNREDFNNDRVDAGEIGAGHTVTAIYEITPVDSAARLVDALRYQPDTAPAAAGRSDEYAFLRIRYKLPDEDTSRLIETPASGANAINASGNAVVAREAHFAASVAAFGQLLRGGRYMAGFSYDDVVALAQAHKGEDAFGYRAEFINLVRLARSAASMERLRQ